MFVGCILVDSSGAENLRLICESIFKLALEKDIELIIFYGEFSSDFEYFMDFLDKDDRLTTISFADKDEASAKIYDFCQKESRVIRYN